MSESTENSLFVQICVGLLFFIWLFFNIKIFIRDQKWIVNYLNSLNKNYRDLTFDERVVVQKRILRHFGVFVLTGLFFSLSSLIIGGLYYGWLL